jgi:hypothetical protein
MGKVMRPLLDRPDRVFKVWSYDVSMSVLVLRSPKHLAEDRRIDVVFQGVFYMRLPVKLDGLRIDEVDQASSPQPFEEIGSTQAEELRIFELISDPIRGLVAARAFQVFEDDGEYYDPVEYPVWTSLRPKNSPN